jgi:hypothetical protein
MGELSSGTSIEGYQVLQMSGFPYQCYRLYYDGNPWDYVPERCATVRLMVPLVFYGVEYLHTIRSVLFYKDPIMILTTPEERAVSRFTIVANWRKGGIPWSLNGDDLPIEES